MKKRRIVIEEEEFVSRKKVLMSTIVVLMAIILYFLLFYESIFTLLLPFILLSIVFATAIFAFESMRFKSTNRSLKRGRSYEYIEAVDKRTTTRLKVLQILAAGIFFLILTLLPFYMVSIVNPSMIFTLIISAGLGLNMGELIFFCRVKWWKKRHTISLTKCKFKKGGIHEEKEMRCYRLADKRKADRKG